MFRFAFACLFQPTWLLARPSYDTDFNMLKATHLSTGNMNQTTSSAPAAPAASTTPAAVSGKNELIRAAVDAWCPPELLRIILSYSATSQTLYLMCVTEERSVGKMYRAHFRPRRQEEETTTGILWWEHVFTLPTNNAIDVVVLAAPVPFGSGNDASQLIAYDTDSRVVNTLTRQHHFTASGAATPAVSECSCLERELTACKIVASPLPSGVIAEAALVSSYCTERWGADRTVQLHSEVKRIASVADTSRSVLAIGTTELFGVYSGCGQNRSQTRNDPSQSAAVEWKRQTAGPFNSYAAMSYRLNTATGAVTRVASPPAPRQQFALAFDPVTNSVWLTGGTAFGYDDRGHDNPESMPIPIDPYPNYCYDITTNQWYTIAPCRTARRLHGSCIYRRHLLVAGGNWSRHRAKPIVDVEAFPIPNSQSEWKSVTTTKWLPDGTYPDVHYTGMTRLFVLNGKVWAYSVGDGGRTLRTDPVTNRSPISIRLCWLDDSGAGTSDSTIAGTGTGTGVGAAAGTSPSIWRDVDVNCPDMSIEVGYSHYDMPIVI